MVSSCREAMYVVWCLERGGELSASEDGVRGGRRRWDSLLRSVVNVGGCG